MTCSELFSDRKSWVVFWLTDGGDLMRILGVKRAVKEFFGEKYTIQGALFEGVNWGLKWIDNITLKRLWSVIFKRSKPVTNL